MVFFSTHFLGNFTERDTVFDWVDHAFVKYGVVSCLTSRGHTAPFHQHLSASLQYFPLEAVCTTGTTTETQIQAPIIPLNSHQNGLYIHITLASAYCVYATYIHSKEGVFCLTAREDTNSKEHPLITNKTIECTAAFYACHFMSSVKWNPPLTRVLRGLWFDSEHVMWQSMEPIHWQHGQRCLFGLINCLLELLHPEFL